MGIDGLLRSLKEVVTNRHLSEYKGKVVAVDAYVWLHKIIKGVCMNEHLEGRLSDRFVKECLARIEAMQSMGVFVMMVFDGGRLPSKEGEQQTRQQKREDCRAKAQELISKGQHDLARRKMAESYDISPDVAYRLIVALKDRKLPFIVAPYEADAQLAYLSRNGLVDVVITEDSDLLPYGARCVLYKLDYSTYRGDELNLERLKDNPDPCLRSFTHCMFLSACILSGCDYLPQVRGVGLKSAFQLIGRNKNGRRAIHQLRLTVRSIPSDYEEGFIRAFLTFRFQRVYCPRTRKCVMVNNINFKDYVKSQLARQQNFNDSVIEISDWIDEVLDLYVLQEVSTRERDLSFLGKEYSDDLIQKIAEGFINPITLEAYKPCSIGRHIEMEGNIPNKLIKPYRPASKKHSKVQHGQIKLTQMSSLSQRNVGFSHRQTVIIQQAKEVTISEVFEIRDMKKNSKKISETLHLENSEQAVSEMFPITKLSKPKLRVNHENPGPTKPKTFAEIIESPLLSPMFTMDQIKGYFHK